MSRYERTGRRKLPGYYRAMDRQIRTILRYGLPKERSGIRELAAYLSKTINQRRKPILALLLRVFVFPEF